LCGTTLIPNRAAKLKSAKNSSEKLPMGCAHCRWATLVALKAEKLRPWLNRLRPIKVSLG
jgi:RNase P subunit RPR2